MKSIAPLLLCFTVAASACAGPTTPPPGEEPDADTGGEPSDPPAKVDAKGTSTPTETPDAAVTSPGKDTEEPVATEDAGAPAAPDMAPSTTPPPPGDYGCTMVIGIAATGQWFNAGFEKLVPNDKWEVVAVHSAKIENWANPNDKLWAAKPSSACAQNGGNPDRIIFVGLNWVYDTLEQWVPPLIATVKNFKAKYSNLKRLELATFVRAPMNKPCPASMPFKSWIKPAQDQANEMVAAMFPDWVVVAPKFEVKTCGDFGGNPPHFTSGAATATAKMIADYYLGKQP
jgi:hypothetical protein